MYRKVPIHTLENTTNKICTKKNYLSIKEIFYECRKYNKITNNVIMVTQFFYDDFDA